MLKRLFAILTAGAVAYGAWAVTPNLIKNSDRAACARWVDSVYSTLTPRERVAQLIFPKTMPAQGNNSKAAIKRYAENGVGGLLFTAGTLDQYVEMTNYVQSITKVPVLMTFDGEWAWRCASTAPRSIRATWP